MHNGISPSSCWQRRIDTNFFRSPPINIEDIGHVHFRMRARESENVHLVRADVRIDGSTIFVAFSPADEGWPFVIENDSDYKISMQQTVTLLSVVSRYV